MLDGSLGVLAWHRSVLDRLAYGAVVFFVEAKLYPLFAFLFGYGMGLQWRRLQSLGIDARTVLWRRYGFLLALGVLHGALVFFGDILTSYALTGMLVLVLGGLARRRPGQQALLWLALYGLLIALLVASDTLDAPPDLGRQAADLALRAARWTDHPWDGFTARAAYFAELVGAAQLTVFLPELLFLFYLGAWAAERGWLEHPGRHPGVRRAALWVGVTLGVPINGALAFASVALLGEAPLPHGLSAAQTVLTQCAFLMTPLYVTALAWVAARAQRLAAAARLVGVLANLGRLALSGYLLQSFIMLGLVHVPALWHLGFAALAAIGLAVVCAELALAALYLRRFSQGPFEWLWRRFTYAAML